MRSDGRHVVCAARYEYASSECASLWLLPLAQYDAGKLRLFGTYRRVPETVGSPWGYGRARETVVSVYAVAKPSVVRGYTVARIRETVKSSVKYGRIPKTVGGLLIG